MADTVTPIETDEERARRLAALTTTIASPMTPMGLHHVGGVLMHPEVPKPIGQDVTPPDIGGAPQAPGTLAHVGEVKTLPNLGYKERQALPNISPGVAPGSSAFYQGKLEKLEDQKANPWGSDENHPGFLGKLAHIGAKVGNIAGDILAPATMAMIPGTDMNRQAQINQIEPRLANAKAAEEGTAERQAAGKRADTAEARAERHEEFEEDKPEKPGTPDEQAIEAKQKETNPTTGKPFTAYEARIALAQDIENTKPDKNAAEPKTVTMLDKEGGKPYLYQHDPKGNYSGNEGTGQWKKIGPAQPNATTLGIVGTMQPLLNPDGSFSGKTFNNKTGKIGETDTSGIGGATTSSGARLKNTEANQFNTQYVKPATDIEQNFKKFENAYADYQNDPKTGAASMVALAQHLGSTFGSVKGAQMGENMINEHKDAIGLFDRIGRFADMLATGQQLSADQWKDFHGLIANTRQIQWETTAREAARRGQPVNMVPADVPINMQDSSGKVRHVPGNRVQEYLDKGAKLAE